MTITKKLLAVAATLALTVTGLVASAGAASAAGTNIYRIDLNKSSAASNAAEFTTCKGKVYFSADMTVKGRGIFSVDEATPGAATFVASNGDGINKPDPRNLSCIGDYVVYVDQPQRTNMYALYAYNTVTGVNAEVKGPGDVSFKMGWDSTPKFATVNGTSYFISSLDGAPQNLWSFDGATGAVTSVGGGISVESGTLTALGSTLYVIINGQLASFDMVSETWSTVSVGGSDVKIQGVYRYNGADVLVLDATVRSWTHGNFYVDTTGSVMRFGTWTTSYGTSFVNLGERLFEYQWGGFAEIKTADGELDEQIQNLFPGANRVGIENAVQTNGALIMMVMNDSQQTNPTGKEMLYRYDATQQAIPLQQTAPVANNTSIPEYPNFQRGWSRNTAMYATSTGLIVNLYLDSAIGYEPYYVTPFGQVTSLGNLNTATDGSSPYNDCPGSTGTVDYVSAGTIDESGTVHNTLTQLKPNGIYLDATVLDLGSANSPCGFAKSGTDLYYQAYDRTASNQTLYKMDATGNITTIGNIQNDGEMAYFADNKYFYKDYDDTIWVYDLTTNTSTQILANGNDNFNSVREIVGVGSKLYFVGEDNSNYYTNVYSLDTANISAPPVQLTNVTDNNWKVRPNHLKLSGTTLYFGGAADQVTGAKIYSIDTTKNDPAQVVVDLMPDSSVAEYVNSFFLSGTDAWVIVGDDNSNDQYLVKVNLTAKTAAVQSLPAGFNMSCAAPAGKKLLLESRDGQLKYFADGVLTDAGMSLMPNDDQYVCYSGSTAIGTYLSFPVSPLIGSNSGHELYYVGPLIPRIVSRLGNNTPEAPATGLGTGVDTGWVAPGGETPSVTPVDTDNPSLGSLTETKTFNGSKGSVTFPDGSGFDVDAKGRIFSKFKSKFLVMVTGSIKVTYKVGKATKTYTCTLKPYGSKVKLKKPLTAPKLYKSKQGCQMPAAAISAMKVGKITIVQKATMTRYYPTTALLKTPTGKAIKKLVRNMTVKMGK